MLNVPNRFVNETRANADRMNENFTAIATKLNGNIGNDDVDEISESKVVFANDKHDHSGGAKGAPIALNESAITFDNVDGHTHDKDDAALAALAVINGNRGTVIVGSDEKDVAEAGSETISFAELDTPLTLTYIISLEVWWDESGDGSEHLTNKYIGGGYDVDNTEFRGYYLSSITEAGFTINNNLQFDSADPTAIGTDDVTFHWRVVGI